MDRSAHTEISVDENLQELQKNKTDEARQNSTKDTVTIEPLERREPTLIGQGTYGRVFREDDPEHGLVARKFFRNAVERTFLELQWALHLAHPHILGALDVRPSIGAPMQACMTMRYVDKTPVQNLAVVARGLLSALVHLHEHGIVHLDIKPDNVLVGPGDHAFLIDFSLTSLSTSLNSAQREIWPTLMFRAPELFERLPHLHASPAVDIWALGCTLYQMRCDRTYVRQIVRRSSDLEQTLRLFWRMTKPVANASPLLPDANCRITNESERDLLEKMLALSPGLRWTAARCLDHPYIAQAHTVHQANGFLPTDQRESNPEVTPKMLPKAFEMRPQISRRERAKLCQWCYRMAAEHHLSWSAFVHAVALFDRVVALSQVRGSLDAHETFKNVDEQRQEPIKNVDEQHQEPIKESSDELLDAERAGGKATPMPTPRIAKQSPDDDSHGSFQFEMAACAFASFFVHDNAVFEEETYFSQSRNAYMRFRNTLWRTYSCLNWEFRLAMPDLTYVDKRTLAAVLISGTVYDNADWLSEALQTPEPLMRICEARIRRHMSDYVFRHLA